MIFQNAIGLHFLICLEIEIQSYCILLFVKNNFSKCNRFAFFNLSRNWKCKHAAFSFFLFVKNETSKCNRFAFLFRDKIGYANLLHFHFLIL